jgi:hypothetical protein
MDGTKRVRIAKRGQSGRRSQPAREGASAAARDSRREAGLVVSGWVREHVRRAEEFRRSYSRLLE